MVFKFSNKSEQGEEDQKEQRKMAESEEAPLTF